MSNLEGQQAPSFSLDGSDGKRHSLSDYKGKTVILYFYPKDDTPGCTKEACGFRDSIESVTNSNAVVLGVSKDNIDSHNQFITKYNLPFTLLSDPEAEVMKSYGAWVSGKIWRARQSKAPFVLRPLSVLTARCYVIGPR